MVNAWLSGNKRGESVVKVPFQTALLLDKLFSDMVRVVDCHAGVLGLKPGDPKHFPLGITSVCLILLLSHPGILGIM